MKRFGVVMFVLLSLNAVAQFHVGKTEPVIQPDATVAPKRGGVRSDTPPIKPTVRDGYAYPITYDPAKFRVNIVVATLPVPESTWLSVREQTKSAFGTFPVTLWVKRGPSVWAAEVLRIPDAPSQTVLFPLKSSIFKQGDVAIVEYSVGLFTPALMASVIDNRSNDPVTVPLFHQRFSTPPFSAPRVRPVRLAATVPDVSLLPSTVETLDDAERALEIARSIRMLAAEYAHEQIFADGFVSPEEHVARRRLAKHDSTFVSAEDAAKRAINDGDLDSFAEAYDQIVDVLLNPIGIRDPFNQEDNVAGWSDR